MTLKIRGKAIVEVRHEGKLTPFEPFTSYVELREGGSIFRTSYTRNEIVLSSMWLLKELGSFKSYEAEIKTPRGAIIDEKGEGFWINNNDYFFSNNSMNPVIILGNFSRIKKEYLRVSIEVYNANKGTVDTITSIIRNYSQFLDYPYPNLKVFYLESLSQKAGFEFPRGIILVHPERNEILLLAHEIAHVWFGDYASFGRVDKSLANYLAIVCTGSYGLIDYVENSLANSTYSLVRIYEGNVFNPRAEAEIYYKGAFIFRSLQFVLGNETFFEGLRELLRACHNRECNLTDIQGIFERVSGRDLDWFFREWFYSKEMPRYRISSLRGYLEFDIIDKSNFTMPMEVQVITPNQELHKEDMGKWKCKSEI